MIQGGDSSALHAFTTGGARRAASRVHRRLDRVRPIRRRLRGRRPNDIVATTREGYLMSWRTDGSASANQEGGAHTTMSATPAIRRRHPPARDPARRLRVRGPFAACLRRPGDDWYDGTPDHYDIATSPDAITPESFDAAPPSAGAHPRRRGNGSVIAVPAGAERHIAIRAADERATSGRCTTSTSSRDAPGGGGAATAREPGTAVRGPDRPARQLHEEEASQAAPQAPPKASAKKCKKRKHRHRKAA